MLLHTVAPLSKRLPFSKGGARSARAVREAARSKPSKARSIASEPCERREATMPHCGMLSASADGVASAKLLGLSVRPLPFHCTTLAMSCPAPRLAASVLGLLYSNRGGRLASGSVARRLLRIVGTRESRKRACEHPKARRAEVVSTRSKAQCAATEHRAAKGGTVRRCGTTMPNCGTEALSRFNRPRRRVRRGRGDFAAENPIFQSKNRFLAVSAPGNP